MNGKFLLNRRDAKIMGVGAGIADWMGVDALFVRLGLVVAALVFPVTILLYILTGWLASDR
ncbi:PspC domain-containing protein [Sphingomonas ginkgonis]|uniref:PspC domain-containing protein n=1 Tax=Sphingomonas ginkgonis TaxID=2315330 RepID=A0A3R9WMC6_9SPHN|nr:PspC domain-containing protein [Sphingomonas ginkgonis]RST29820.1 PspC domain-containing protein [Sphingomonas ginkgonis]